MVDVLFVLILFFMAIVGTDAAYQRGAQVVSAIQATGVKKVTFP